MSVADKLTKKELRSPDAFLQAGAEAGQWVQARERLVVAAIVVVLGGGLALSLVSYYSSRGEEHASQELGLAMKVVSRPVATEPSTATPADGEEAPFKSEKEKDAAIVQAMQAFEASHHGGKAAAMAELARAQAQLRLGQYDEAQQGFEGYLKASPTAEPLRMTALEGQGYALEGKGQLDAALKAFDDMSHEDKSEFLSGMGMYHRARILALQGKKQEAAQAFADVQSKFEKTAAARLAGDRLALLASQGFKPAAPAPLPSSTLNPAK